MIECRFVSFTCLGVQRTSASRRTEGGSMSKPVTAIISDLHLGGGSEDLGDDHVYQGDPLVRLLRNELGTSERGKRGEIEILINGDLFEFAQVRPDFYTGGDYSTWSREAESLQRLNV